MEKRVSWYNITGYHYYYNIKLIVIHRFNTSRTVRILERRYPLTKTGYKFLDIGVTVYPPSRVNIAIGDYHGKEISLSPDMWNRFMEQKRTIQAYIEDDSEDKRLPTPIYIEHLTIRFGRINNASTYTDRSYDLSNKYRNEFIRSRTLRESSCYIPEHYNG